MPIRTGRQRSSEKKHREHRADRLLVELAISPGPKTCDGDAAVALGAQRLHPVSEARCIELAKEILELEYDALRLQLPAGIAESDSVARDDAHGFQLRRKAPALDIRVGHGCRQCARKRLEQDRALPIDFAALADCLVLLRLDHRPLPLDLAHLALQA